MSETDGGRDVFGRRYRPHPEVIGQQLGSERVLVNLQTEQIFELNRTASRFWELLQSSADLNEVRQKLLAEFEVPEDQLTRELHAIVQALVADNLLIPDPA